MLESQVLLDNRYTIVHIERTKNFSWVFFALDTYQNPARNCVIKAFKPIVQKSQIVRRIDREFCQEADRLKKLSLVNQHLPQIYTYFSDSQTYYLVRELIEGRTLVEKVKSEGSLSTEEVRHIMVELLSVLGYLHQQGVIHQNIQPKNIILRRDDRLPMLINFGSIKQVVSTVDFHGNKQVFSLKNTYSYIPSEQVIGKPIPASDLYSLGLTAIYLLTGKNPIELPISLKYNSFEIPIKIKDLDPNLYAIIARVISLNPSERYTTAEEMKNALLQINTEGFLNSKKIHFEGSKPFTKAIGFTKYRNIAHKGRNSANSLNWWTILFIIFGIFCIIDLLWMTWYDWNLAQNTVAPQLPEPSIPLPYELSALPEVSYSPSILNPQWESLIDIPVFATGTNKEQIKNVLGEPSSIQEGYWANSNALIYQDRARGLVDLGYLFDLETNKLRQTEIAIAPAAGLSTIQEILDSLLQGNTTQSINLELQKIYGGQADTHSFKLGDLEGSIERDENDNIYLGVWEADFH